jgi:hypothetical protein
VCLPRQPMPARAASSTSITGAESAKARCRRAAVGLDALAELLQAAAHHLVVVAAARVARDVACRCLQLSLDAPACPRGSPCGRKSRARCPAPAPPVASGAGVARHIIHLAVPPIPAIRRGGRRPRTVDVRDADRLEAEFGAPLLDPIRERRPWQTILVCRRGRHAAAGRACAAGATKGLVLHLRGELGSRQKPLPGACFRALGHPGRVKEPDLHAG